MAEQQQPAGPAGANAPHGLLRRLLGFDSWLHSAASLSIVTVIAGWFGTYLQYLNSYEQKVSETAQTDMKDATATFVEISNAFAEAQMLQQLIYFNFAAAASDADPSGDKAMTTKAGQDIYPAYVKARTALRQNVNIHARKAELYIDWASNLEHDAADTAAIDGDPLTETLLGDYNFDCDATENFPHYELTAPGAEPDRSAPPQTPEQRSKFKDAFCLAPNETEKQAVTGSETMFCAVDDDGKIDHARPSRQINWLSAKHHVLVMHYCFEGTHSQILPARIWASGNEVSAQLKDEFARKKKNGVYQDSLDHEVIRLDAFLSLAMSELERIRVKYRPSSFYCSLPLINYAISDRCMPIKIAKSRR